MVLPPELIEKRRGAFVGRRRELLELDSGLADALAGRGALFLLMGEPGIGKTRLADEFCVHAEAAGALTFWGRCWEGGGAPAYWPWVQVVRSYLRQSEPDSLRKALGGGAVHIAQIVPELREVIPDLPSAPILEPERLRFSLFDAMSALLRSAPRPVVILLDDVHAADRASLLLLRFLATELRRSKLMVLASYREADVRHDAEAGALIDELGRLGRGIALRGLDDAEVLGLIAGIGGRPPDRALARRLHQITNGNPFFVDELVRLLHAEGRLEGPFSPGDPLGIPHGVEGAIRLRLAALSPEADEVLAVASVIGRDFDARVVERVSRLPAERALVAVDEAVAAQLVVEVWRAARRYSFRHGLVRETLYQALPAARRAQLHRDVAEALEQIHGDEDDAHVAELAHHHFEAASVGGAGRALEFAERAGDRAAAVLAYEEARGHYERALQSLALSGAEDRRRRCRLLLSRAEAEWTAGDSTVARRTFQSAARLAGRLGAGDLLARAAMGYAGGLGGFLHVVRADQTILALLEEALAALEETDTALRVRLLARLAVELYYTEQVERRVALSKDAIEMARRIEDRGSLLVALYSRHWAACGPETLSERLANATEMVSLARLVGNTEMTFLGHHVRLSCLLELCDVRAVDGELQAMIELAEELRQPYYRWRTTSLRAMRAILDARFEQAERLVDEAFALGRGSDSEITRVVREGAQMFALRFGQGRLAELEPWVLDFTQRYPWIQPWRLPLLYSELGRLSEARAELERQAVGDFGDFPRDALWITRVAALAHACAFVEDADRAKQLYAMLLPYADRNVSTIADQSYGPVATRLGMLAGVLQRWDDAEAHFVRGLALCRTLGAPTFLALNLLEHGRMRIARGRPADRERAAELLHEAEAICAERGISGLLERVRREATRVGPSASPESVFHRDGEYWTIAYAGDVFRLKDGKGLRYLAQLLASPGVELHALDLVAVAGGRPRDGAGTTGAQAVREGMRASRMGGVGPALDEQAKAAYRRRVGELEAELEQARAFHDPERAALLEQEMDALMRELAGAVGLGGRDREVASPSERARVNVTRAIRGVLTRIEEHSPALAGHLAQAVRTGTFCAYLPAPTNRPAWRL